MFFLGSPLLIIVMEVGSLFIHVFNVDEGRIVIHTCTNVDGSGIPSLLIHVTYVDEDGILIFFMLPMFICVTYVDGGEILINKKLAILMW